MPNKFTLSRLRVSWLLFAILTLCSTRTFAAVGDKFTYDGIKYEVISDKDNTCRTARSRQVSGDIVLPSSVPYGDKSYILKEIGYNTFYECSSLTSVTIPSSVTSIGESAFRGCSSLKSVAIPKSVTSIGDGAFRDCSSLTSVTIPNSVTSLGKFAFTGCSSLKSVTIPNSMTSIGDYAFSGCSSLTSVTIPNSVTSIGESAFSGCSSLTSVTIPNSVTLIDNWTFSGCSSLTSVTIPSSVTLIRGYAFSGCSSLTSVTIPNSVTLIGVSAFFGCSSLTSVTIPNSVTSIGSYAFEGCSSLTTVTIPNSVTSIGGNVFVGCSSLKSILVEKGSQNYSSDGVALYNADKTALISVPGATTTFTLPNSVTSLGSYAFEGCSSLTSVTIPSSVTSIDGNVFVGCSSLKSILVEKGNQNYSSDGVALYNADKTALISVPRATTTFTIPNSVTSIGDYAFYGCSSLTSVTIPSSVTLIGDYAFSGCSSLTSVTIPSSVTLIREYAFYECKSLTSLDIPESVKSIYSHTFSGCTLYPLRFMGTVSLYKESLDYLKGSIECKSEQVEYIKQFTTLPVVAWDKKYYLTKVKPLIAGFNVHIMHNADFGSTEGDTDLKIIVLDAVGNEVKSVPVAVDQDILITGLKPKTSYKLVLSWKDSAGELCSNSELLLSTKRTTITTSTDNIKQTSFEVASVEADSDESFQVSEVGFELDGKKYVYKGKSIEIKGLLPEKDYQLYPYVIYNDGLVFNGQAITVATKGWDFACSISNAGPTSAVFTATFTEDDAKAENVWWNFDGQRVDGTNLTLLSLTPETEYTARFRIEYGGKYYDYTESFTTSAVEFKNLKPKCVSSSCAIVAAETNISDIEPMVGFEWKKYDAPASLAPNEGYGAVCEGILEGYIKNLQTTSFYNVRPFYKSAEGKYYYGEWVTFDPSDFSYFEPTVRTYPVQEVTTSSATVRGYAMPGTDNIKRQGFQYWRSGGKNNIAAMVPAESEIMTVEVSGQVMVATFSDLIEGTTYTYRAFVETDAGYAYGEEQTFTTESVSGVYDVEYAKPEVTVVGYYDIMGLRYDEPVRGINIVVYSDGSAKKVVYSER